MSALDSRAWVVWGAAATLPLLTGRHPFVLLEVIVIVLVVRSVCVPPTRAMAWGWLARLSALAVPLGVVINLLTVHAGDQVILRVPESVPLAGGDLTWNAAAYGALSGLTVVALVLIGTTVAAGIDWSELMRLLPARAASLAVAGSVAWTFLPRLAVSWREIREAQTARGHRWSGPRDAVPLIVPLLAGGLDRSIMMAEALEARGFGATSTGHSSVRSSVGIGFGVIAAVTGLYLFAVGRSLAAGTLLTAAAIVAGVALLAGSTASSRRVTRYRESQWTGQDSAVVIADGVAIAFTGWALQAAPGSLRYDPYPSLTWPAGSVWLLLGLALLLLPAVIAPAALVDEGRP